MNKKEFINNTEPLTMIVCFDPKNGISTYSTYPTGEADFWVSEFEKDFPNCIVFRTTNKQGVKYRKRLFSIAV